MIDPKKQFNNLMVMGQSNGFSAIELLITLFIASAFLISGYQLYAVVIKDNREARIQALAVNVSQDYLNRYKSSATNPCTVVPSLPDGQSITVSGLSNATVTVTITCPYNSTPTPTPTVSKVSVKIKYGDDDPQKEINNATYVSQ